MQKDNQYTPAAKLLFEHLANHNYDDVASYEDFFNNRSNGTMLELLQELCQHFDIDADKVAQYIKATRKCDYRGVNYAPDEDENGEHVCVECLEKFGE